MIAYGRNGQHFYSFGEPLETEGYPVMHFELRRTLPGFPDEPYLCDVFIHCVTFRGRLTVEIDKPFKLVEFKSKLPGPVKIVEFHPGKVTFQIIRLEIPECSTTRVIDLALLPHTTLGLAKGGLETLLRKQCRGQDRLVHQAELHHLLEMELLRRLVVAHIRELELVEE